MNKSESRKYNKILSSLAPGKKIALKVCDGYSGYVSYLTPAEEQKLEAERESRLQMQAQKIEEARAIRDAQVREQYLQSRKGKYQYTQYQKTKPTTIQPKKVQYSPIRRIENPEVKTTISSLKEDIQNAKISTQEIVVSTTPAITEEESQVIVDQLLDSTNQLPFSDDAERLLSELSLLRTTSSSLEEVDQFFISQNWRLISNLLSHELDYWCSFAQKYLNDGALLASDIKKESEKLLKILAFNQAPPVSIKMLQLKLQKIQLIGDILLSNRYFQPSQVSYIFKKMHIPKFLKKHASISKSPIKGLDVNTTVVKDGNFEFTFNVQNNKKMQKVPAQFKGQPLKDLPLSTPLNSDYCLLFCMVAALFPKGETDPEHEYRFGHSSFDVKVKFRGEVFSPHSIMFKIYQLYNRSQFDKREEDELHYCLYEIMSLLVHELTGKKSNNVANLFGLQNIRSVDDMINWKPQLQNSLKALDSMKLKYKVCNQSPAGIDLNDILIAQLAGQYHAMIISKTKFESTYLIPNTTFLSCMEELGLLDQVTKDGVLDCIENLRKSTGNPHYELSPHELRYAVVMVNPEWIQQVFFGTEMKKTKGGKSIGYDLFFTNKIVNSSTIKYLIYKPYDSYTWEYTILPAGAQLDKPTSTLKYVEIESSEDRKKRFKKEREIEKAMRDINNNEEPESPSKLQRFQSKNGDINITKQKDVTKVEHRYIDQTTKSNIEQKTTSENTNINTIEQNSTINQTTTNQSNIITTNKSVNVNRNQIDQNTVSQINSTIRNTQDIDSFHREQQQGINNFQFSNAKLNVEVKNGEDFIDLESIKFNREVRKLQEESSIYRTYTRNRNNNQVRMFPYLDAWQVIDNKISNISLNLKFGDFAQKEIEKRFTTEYQIAKLQNKFTGHYGHPFLRWVVDYLTCEAFSKIDVPIIVEVAGKIHKNIKMASQKKFINFRPQLNSYDKLYWDHHQDLISNLENNGRLLMLNEPFSSELNMHASIRECAGNPLYQQITTEYNNQYKKILLSVDSIYYPGVRAGITNFLRQVPSAKAYVIFSVYVTQAGVYHYYDSEGHFKIFIKNNEYWVENKPKDNQTPYSHRLQNWPLKEMYAGLDENNIYWSEINYIQTSPYSKTVLVELTYFQGGESSEQSSTIFKDVNKQIETGKTVKKFGWKILDSLLGRDERLINKVEQMNNVDWALYDDEYYNMAVLFYSTLETEEMMKSGHFSRCLRAILVNKGLIKINASVNESMLQRIRYNIHRAYILHIINRGSDKHFIKGMKAMQPVDWKALILNKDNMYKALLSAGLAALATSIPLAAPVAIGVKAVSAISGVSTLFGAAKEGLKNLLSITPKINNIDIVDKNDIIAGSSKLFKNQPQMVNPQMPNVFNEISEVQIIPETNVISWQQKDKKELLQSPHENLYNEKLFKSDPKMIKQYLENFVSKPEETYESIRRDETINKQYQHAGFKYDPICNNQSRARLQKKNPTNMLWALFKRQIGHVNKQDVRVVKEFKKYLIKEEYPKWQKIIDEHDYKPLTFEEILQKKNGGKKELYRKAHEKYKIDQQFDTEMEIMMKGDEYQYNNEGKPRILANPSDVGKAYGSYIVTAMQQILMKIYPEICIGLNTGDLQDKLTKDYQEIDDPTILVYDHSNHDAHQYANLKDMCEMKLIDMCYDQCFKQCVDLPFFVYDQLKEFITSTHMKVYFRDPETRRKIRGELTNVTSGHPTSTTMGNNLRVICFINFIKYKAQIPENKIKVNISGDDVIIFINSKYIRIFKKWFSKIYLFDEKFSKPHGLGQLVKGGEIKESKVAIDFLSKLGVVLPNGQILINRQIDRGLISGNVTKKINKNFLAQDYNWAITTNLESWGFSFPVIREYIKARKNQLVHALTSRIKSKLAAVQLTQDIEYVQHKNAYDMNGKTEFFYNIYSPIVIAQMESKISQAPLYIHKLKLL